MVMNALELWRSMSNEQKMKMSANLDTVLAAHLGLGIGNVIWRMETHWRHRKSREMRDGNKCNHLSPAHALVM